jgi:hypothetical protein
MKPNALRFEWTYLTIPNNKIEKLFCKETEKLSKTIRQLFSFLFLLRDRQSNLTDSSAEDFQKDNRLPACEPSPYCLLFDVNRGSLKVPPSSLEFHLILTPSFLLS